MSATTLTAEQLKRIEENRRKALAKKSNRLNQATLSKQSQPKNVIKPTNSTPTAVDSSERGLNSSKGSLVRQTNALSFNCSKSVEDSGKYNQIRSTTAVNYSKSQALHRGPQSSLGKVCPPQVQTQLKATSSASFVTRNFYSSGQSKSTIGHDKKTPQLASQFSSRARSTNVKTSQISSTKTGHFTLISRSHFSVNIPFNAKIIDIFKQMPTKSYDAVNKIWNFNLSDYDKLWKALKSAGMESDLEPLPKAVTTTFRQQRHGEDKPLTAPEVNLNSIDSELVEALMPFQREGVGYAIERHGRVLMADDMGLGKTFQAICVACYYRAEWPLLIVSPSSLRYVWKETLQKWLPSIDPDSINVVQKVKESGTSGLINILSYDLMSRKAAELKSKKFHVVIMDESHFLKNFKTARTKAAIPILKNASRVILLSGTPALSRPSELYVQVNAIDNTLFPVFHEFGLRYCNAHQNKWGWDYSGSSNMTELQLLLEERIMVRRIKKQVLSQLPSKTRQVVMLDPALVNTNCKSFLSSSKGMANSKSGNDKSALLQYFNETGLVKMKAIKDYVVDLLECGCKFLVFAHHQAVLDMLCEVLKEKKKGFMRIDGSTSLEKRQENCDVFQMNDECVAAVLSITAANSGLTLTAASLVIFAELFWNPGILMQAEDRVHRIGQKECVMIRYLVAKNTADDYIWPLIQEKLKVLGKAGLSKDNFNNADMTNFKDPKQKDILSYFERSFIEDDMEDDEEILQQISEMEDAAIYEELSQESADVDTPGDIRIGGNSSDDIKTLMGKKRKVSQDENLNKTLFSSVSNTVHDTESKHKKVKQS
ncbi:SWI/SNF-related matrix-associated actin-dependent regulator of chromatin subfamily A-like protein 1 [Anneissia japonica]|uniref:SWI/SNF-related matrix-associated actin-dependent regulator of chromatin subfamily A-like protein 1 n=1 Tax=Anneissia japonica TaxID=1529436 RepID=UPI001425B8D1|nr:SWI/SNF-related matrix-associated actin-dependent regulator of chromatin subfamily A-like protein 1 [Anneissia japonica]